MLREGLATSSGEHLHDVCRDVAGRYHAHLSNSEYHERLWLMLRPNAKRGHTTGRKVLVARAGGEDQQPSMPFDPVVIRTRGDK